MDIALDMMGGDFAPEELVKGVCDYISEKTPALLSLIGDEQQLKPLLDQYKLPADAYRIIPSTEVIGMHEHPLKALKEKPKSSIAIGFGLLAAGKTDAFISAGNTGAMLIGSLFTIKPIEGIQRPTIGTIVPMENGSTGLLLDVGANADCKAEHLDQFATLGSLYAQYISRHRKPTGRTDQYRRRRRQRQCAGPGHLSPAERQYPDSFYRQHRRKRCFP